MRIRRYKNGEVAIIGKLNMVELANFIAEESATYFAQKRGDDPVTITGNSDVVDYLKATMMPQPSECFGVLFMDNRHVIIEYRIMFRGSVASCSVHPRELVKAALDVNAAAIILTHNHPSGNPKPSDADQNITDVIIDAMKLIDVRVLDHVVIGANGETFSFSSHGMI